MYLEFFRFERPPFNLTPDSRFLYLSERHREALASLEYGIKGRKGFIVLTGDIGAGKTTICRSLLKRLDENTRVALILNSFLTDIEILQTINDELGVQYKDASSKKALIDALNVELIRACAAGNDVLVIIDEAQNLSPASLEQVRMLSNLETESDKLLQILLMGQPELRDTLHLPQLEQLNQRVTVRYHLMPLTRDEVREYLYHRMEIAGPSHSAEFDDDAVEAIWEFSRGVPRKINLVADRALLGGYAAQCHIVDRDLVEQAIREVAGEVHEAPAEAETIEAPAPAALATASAGAATASRDSNARSGAAGESSPVGPMPGGPAYPFPQGGYGPAAGYAPGLAAPFGYSYAGGPPAPGYAPFPGFGAPPPSGIYQQPPYFVQPGPPQMAASYPQPAGESSSAAAAAMPRRSFGPWLAGLAIIAFSIIGGVAAALYWPPTNRPAPKLPESARVDKQDFPTGGSTNSPAGLSNGVGATAAGAVTANALPAAAPFRAAAPRPQTPAPQEPKAPAGSAKVEPWSVDKDGLVRVVDPSHFLLASELNLMRQGFGVEINARRISTLSDDLLGSLSVLDLPELKQRNLRKATLGNLDEALALETPLLLQVDAPAESRLSPVLLMLRQDEASQRIVVGDPLNGMGRLPREALEGIFRGAVVYFYDDDDLGSLTDGDSGPRVAQLERILQSAGSWPPDTGEPDGSFALFTHQAIKRFQRAHRLPVSGQLDAATVFYLTEAAEALDASESSGGDAAEALGSPLGDAPSSAAEADSGGESGSSAPVPMEERGLE